MKASNACSRPRPRMTRTSVSVPTLCPASTRSMVRAPTPARAARSRTRRFWRRRSVLSRAPSSRNTSGVRLVWDDRSHLLALLSAPRLRLRATCGTCLRRVNLGGPEGDGHSAIYYAQSIYVTCTRRIPASYADVTDRVVSVRRTLRHRLSTHVPPAGAGVSAVRWQHCSDDRFRWKENPMRRYALPSLFLAILASPVSPGAPRAEPFAHRFGDALDAGPRWGTSS